MTIPLPRSVSGTNMMSMNKEPYSERAYNPPISSDRLWTLEELVEQTSE